MCLIIAFVSLSYAVVAFNAGNFAVGSIALVIALFFSALLYKNVFDVKKMRQERKDEEENKTIKTEGKT